MKLRKRDALLTSRIDGGEGRIGGGEGRIERGWRGLKKIVGRLRQLYQYAMRHPGA